MTRPLSVIAADPAAVLIALRAALAGSGPAVFPRALDASPVVPGSLPAEVPRRVALVVETSGSTAKPKRVAHSSDALLASAAASDSALGGAGQWLLALPAHYIAGLNVLVRSIAAGTDPVILPSGPFDPIAFAAAADRMDAPLRFTSLVPAQLGQLLGADVAVRALRRFDRILVGGQSTPAVLLERAAELGVRLTRTYGSSETAGGCVYDGVPIGNTEVRIHDGQVELAGSVLADGYLDDDERTALAFPSEAGHRWYRTGDTGEVVDGVLRVTGRLDDVIISGGIKVSLADIEREVRALPGQSDAVVVRTPSDRWGEVPVVVTVTPLDLADVRAHLGAILGPAAAPARVVVVPALPLLSSGKPDRRELARLAALHSRHN
ncbi:AMP-binding protein [Glaciihabitans sp. dw_435]|uniref:AMP-binding protein n=1 Tax=Glaciihabitans sp. dw_435 TaxID=2720081 RepID=UPI001BD266D4|nr:AMP-binding protein [Glaciihabitans sp. dw_435]